MFLGFTAVKLVRFIMNASFSDIKHYSLTPKYGKKDWKD
jgi:hypothetical protein